ncbi:MAG: cytochrome c3 family protein, partial [Gammaproteobacteria bacterium]
AKDRKQQQGYHGISPSTTANPCQSCHTDHEGRDADIIGLDPAIFKHNHTNFTLTGAHQALACDSCHHPNKKHRETKSTCFACHKQDDPHKRALGEQCNSCHDATQWQNQQDFDHDKTDFPLIGKHQQAPCLSCHVGERYTFEQTTCVSCHLAKDVHAGNNGTECDSCHSETAWDSIKFDHNKTEFPLRGGHINLPCRACHAPTQTDKSDTPQQCNACHKNDDPHFGRNGSKCNNCHSTKNWNTSLFEHNKDTDFTLTGKHKTLTCTACHVGAVEAPLPQDCFGCHRSDDIHQSEELQHCASCHNTQGWQSTSKFDHEFSHFPLIGMHAIVPCSNCHKNSHFTDTASACVSCHRSEDTHQESLGDQCALCHNPNDWGFWTFDHTKQTQFALDGAHKGLACSSCHSPHTSPKKTSDKCIDCHSEQDIHRGGFGDNCAQCHNTHHFSEIFLLDK